MEKIQNIYRQGLSLSFAILVILFAMASCSGDSGDSPSRTNTENSSQQSQDQNSQGEDTQTEDTQDDSSTDQQGSSGSAVIINHASTDIDAIPQEWIEQAKQDLHIAYGHTSHGSQITTGMTGLFGFKGSLYAYNAGGSGDALDLRDKPFSGANDLGDPSRTAWVAATRAYLEGHPEINVIMWSWCGQADTSPENINLYLTNMESLEKDYPDVDFVYMTGHLMGTGLQGNLHLRNEQIRNYCKVNSKILYDFEDIESYDPDGTYFGGKYPDDACNYDSNGDRTRDANWARAWQNSHTEGVDWYDCEAAHSEPLNANLKAYAAWWLWARLAGWNG